MERSSLAQPFDLSSVFANLGILFRNLIQFQNFIYYMYIDNTPSFIFSLKCRLLC